jgi:heme a synthase
VTSLAQPAARAVPTADARAVAMWLFGVAAMVFAMAIIGAITRLTESGLSITEWAPVTGAIPPLNEAQWMAEFDKYRQIPEYQLLKRGMSLEEFKVIYFWEWFHRLWGRLIGVAFLVPFLWFLARGRIPAGYGPRLWALFALGGLQGFVGWFMVQSGLVDRTDVSHYRLAMHLGLAIVIYALLIWTAIGLLEDRRPSAWEGAPRGLKIHGHVALALLAVTICWGAFVAGKDAGLAAADFPTVNGQWIPAEIAFAGMAGFVEDAVVLQWTHRVLATLSLFAIVTLWARLRKAEIGGRLAWVVRALCVAVLAQYALGIATIHTGVSIPVAAAHQGGALVLVGLFMWTLYELRGPVAAHAHS